MCREIRVKLICDSHVRQSIGDIFGDENINKAFDTFIIKVFAQILLGSDGGGVTLHETTWYDSHDDS